MSHQLINNVVYYTIVVIKYILPYGFLFYGLIYWWFASSSDNVEKMKSAQRVVLWASVTIYGLTFAPMFVVSIISGLYRHQTELSSKTVVDIFSLLQLLCIAYIPMASMIMSYVYRYQDIILEGNKRDSKPKARWHRVFSYGMPLLAVAVLEIFKQFFGV